MIDRSLRHLRLWHQASAFHRKWGLYISNERDEYKRLLSSLYRGADWVRGTPTVTKIEHNNIVNVTGPVRFSQSGRFIAVPTYSTSHPIIDGHTGLVYSRINVPSIDKVADYITVDEADNFALVSTWGKVLTYNLHSGILFQPQCDDQQTNENDKYRPECELAGRNVC